MVSVPQRRMVVLPYQRYWLWRCVPQFSSWRHQSRCPELPCIWTQISFHRSVWLDSSTESEEMTVLYYAATHKIYSRWCHGCKAYNTFPLSAAPMLIILILRDRSPSRVSGIASGYGCSHAELFRSTISLWQLLIDDVMVDDHFLLQTM